MAACKCLQQPQSAATGTSAASILPASQPIDHHCKDHSDAASNQEEQPEVQTTKKDLVDMNPSLQEANATPTCSKSSGPHYNTTDQACQTAQHASTQTTLHADVSTVSWGSAPDPAKSISVNVAKIPDLITLGHRAHLTRKRRQRLQHRGLTATQLNCVWAGVCGQMHNDLNSAAVCPGTQRCGSVTFSQRLALCIGPQLPLNTCEAAHECTAAIEYTYSRSAPFQSCNSSMDSEGLGCLTMGLQI
jgi:hypothetical protein